MARFATFVKRRRLKLGLSQRAVDQQVELGSGWMSKFESGEIQSPPNRANCAKLAAALQLPLDELWARAAPERLRAFDEDLLRWHLSELERATGRPHVQIDDDAAEAIAAQIADLDRTLGGQREPSTGEDDATSLSQPLLHLLETLSTFSEGGDDDERIVRRYVAAIHHLEDLPIEVELQLLDVLAAQIELTMSAARNAVPSSRPTDGPPRAERGDT